MKTFLSISLLLLISVVGFAQEKTVDSKIAPVPLKLSVEDQKQLDLINARLEEMKPQLERAQKQQAEAQAKLQEANAFFAQYNQVDAIRMAFLFRVAADVCKCSTSEVAYSEDGKSVIRKPKVDASKGK